jgi:hypothetical protein
MKETRQSIIDGSLIILEYANHVSGRYIGSSDHMRRGV